MVWLLIIVMVVPMLSGCAMFRNPLGSWNKATDKADAAAAEVQKNEDKQVDSARNYVYGTQLALEANPQTNRATEVASSLNERAMLTLGPPEMESALKLQAMVDNLLSTNKAIILKGEKELANMDAQIVDLQKENASLQLKLDKAEQKVESIGQVNAGLAQKWASLVKIFWWIVYGVIAVFVIKILSVVLPPPYNSIVSIIAVPIGLVIKGIHGIVPEAKKAAGVIAEGTYNNTKQTLQHIITAIEEAKRDKPETVKEIVPYLQQETSSEVSKPLITDVKRELGYV